MKKNAKSPAPAEEPPLRGEYTRQYSGKLCFNYHMDSGVVFNIFDGDTVTVPKEGSNLGRELIVFGVENYLLLADGSEVGRVAITMRTSTSLRGGASGYQAARIKADDRFTTFLRRKKLALLAEPA